MTKTEFLGLEGRFLWNFCCYFFIETSKGNFVWSDSDYHGDNTVRRYNGSAEKFCKDYDVPFLRDKGRHIIEDYCGKDIIFEEVV